ncbi:MAG: tetratricopeptide repeat protein [Bacteroidia bacterium]|nr:tetratricopeptide repeat protein [Bacteroidia bacterium]
MVNPDTALFYALEINKQLTKGISKFNVAYNYHVVGTIYSTLSDYQNALLWLEKAYKLKKELDAVESTTLSTHDQLLTVNGIIYAWQGLGDIKKIHEYVLIVEQLSEKLSETNSINYIISLIQIADIYTSLKRNDKADEYFLKAIAKAEITKDDRQLTLAYQNYGANLVNRNLYEKALPYIEKGLVHSEKLNEPKKYIEAKVNLAIIYAEMGKREEALKIFKEVYDQQLKGVDSYEKSSAANNLGFFYFIENKFDKALSLFLESLEFARDAKAFKLVMDRYQIISETYEQLNNYKASLNYSRLYQKLNDSLFNVETVMQLNDLTEKYGNEKKEKKILELKKNNAEIKLKEEETKRVSQRNNIVFGSLMVVVLLIAVFIYYSLLQKKKANLSLTSKNKQIEHQHKLLEEKQKEILDSIHYAKRIQQSLLPTEKYFIKNLTKFKKKS